MHKKVSQQQQQIRHNEQTLSIVFSRSFSFGRTNVRYKKLTFAALKRQLLHECMCWSICA